MTMAHDDQSSDLSSSERAGDDAWLAALAGRGSERDGAGDADAVREASLMRAALMRWAPAIGALPDRDHRRIELLIERARAEGLFDERSATNVTDARNAFRQRGLFDRLRAWWTSEGAPRFGPRPAWAMTLVAGVVIALVFLVRPANEGAFDDDATVRSAPDAVTLLRARDPEVLRREIMAALSQQGVKATTYSRLGRIGLDADVPLPLSREVKAVLDRFRIPMPADGVLRVEIEAERR